VNGSALTVIQGYRDPHSTYGEGGVRCVYLVNGAALVGFTLTNGAAGYGGGVCCESTSAMVSNCLLTGNLAYLGGGASGGTLNNCIVYYNNAPNEDNYSDYIVFNYSCTTPLPTNRIGNLANAPLFVDQAGGNLRLQSNSPCINAGSDASAPAGPDLDGNPRIA